MGAHEIMLLLATLLCTLTAGFVFAFAVVVMPGIRDLEDSGFIRAFQVIDGVIQNNQPAFMTVWVGSVLALLAAVGLGFGPLGGSDRALLIFATGAYLLGVQLPTAVINVPLNNRLQGHDVETMTETALEGARKAFEPRWNRWNTIRTAFATLTAVVLMALLLRL